MYGLFRFNTATCAIPVTYSYILSLILNPEIITLTYTITIAGNDNNKYVLYVYTLSDRVLTLEANKVVLCSNRIKNLTKCSFLVNTDRHIESSDCYSLVMLTAGTSKAALFATLLSVYSLHLFFARWLSRLVTYQRFSIAAT